MRLKPYPEYKNSGVQWLGNSPEHWEVRRLSYFFAERREKVSDKDYQALSVTKNGVVPQLDNAAKTDDGDNRKLVLAGDFAINSRSDRKGSSGLSDLDGSVSLINTVLKPYSNIYGRFAHHLFRSYLFQEEYYKYGRGIVADLWSTNYSEMRNISLAVPNNDEQLSIATFLDCETAKLDTLIAKQEKLIELLQEKRQAIISHAVTKGLDPNVKMRESEVEWLGMVPESWGVNKLKRLCKIFPSNVDKKTVEGEREIKLCNYTDVYYNDEIVESQNFMKASATDAQIERFTLRKDDVIITKDSETANDIGIPSYVSKDIPGVICGYHLSMIRPQSSVSGKYIKFLFNSHYLRAKLENSAKGLTRVGLGQYEIDNLIVPVPSVVEQQNISLYLDTKTNKIDTLIEKSKRSIELAKEHRIALISAAVTGKIDVRDFKEIA